jgi:hypothetical protein
MVILPSFELPGVELKNIWTERQRKDHMERRDSKVDKSQIKNEFGLLYGTKFRYHLNKPLTFISLTEI